MGKIINLLNTGIALLTEERKECQIEAFYEAKKAIDAASIGLIAVAGVLAAASFIPLLGAVAVPGAVFSSAASIYCTIASSALGALADANCPRTPESVVPRPIDPLVFDLDGNGISLTSAVGSTVFFDIDQDGFAERTAWVSPTDGMLALDKNNNGLIDDAGELFGTATADGFKILKAYDTNLDGVINASDSVFADLRI